MASGEGGVATRVGGVVMDGEDGVLPHILSTITVHLYVRPWQ